MKSKIIFLELNEVPYKVLFDYYNSKKFTLSTFKFNSTLSRDETHLSPWITWATIHRGCTYQTHKINDLGQKLDNEKNIPSPIWSDLIEMGYKVGICGSLHSSQVPKSEIPSFEFYIPEPFADSPLSKPSYITPFTKLNLSLSRQSARIVSRKIPPVKILVAGLYSYMRSSYFVAPIISTIHQLINECFQPWMKVRRRVLQSDLLFYLYLKMLNNSKPDFSTFFTNHVASSMHRFWEATYPEDYPKPPHDELWRRKYSQEISFSMKSTSSYIEKLCRFVELNPEFQLWILSSMGQSAMPNYKPQSYFWKIRDLSEFFSSLIKEDIKVEERASMIPLYTIFSEDRILISKLQKIFKSITTNANLHLRSVSNTTLSFYFSCDQTKIEFFNPENSLIETKGIERLLVDENTSSSAYHVPEGIFMRYGKCLTEIPNEYINDGIIFTDSIKSFALQTLGARPINQ